MLLGDAAGVYAHVIGEGSLIRSPVPVLFVLASLLTARRAYIASVDREPIEAAHSCKQQ